MSGERCLCPDYGRGIHVENCPVFVGKYPELAPTPYRSPAHIVVRRAEPDAELVAIREIIAALARLAPDARRRVAEYIVARIAAEGT